VIKANYGVIKELAENIPAIDLHSQLSPCCSVSVTFR
jgi:hypothetical protein